MKQQLVSKKDGNFIFHLRPDQSVKIDAKKGLKNLSIIPLEGTDKSLIGWIKEIKRDSTSGDWYILGGKEQKSILVFSKDGEFIKKIKYVGKGPGQYLIINHFVLADGKYIEIMDNRQRLLIKYSLKTGALISEKRIPFSAFTYAHLNNGDYVYYIQTGASNYGNGKKYLNNILVTGRNFKLIRTRFPFNIKVGHSYSLINSPKTLIAADQKVYYNRFLTDTIYSITPDTIKPTFFIDYGQYKLDNEKKISLKKSGDEYKYLVEHNDQFIIGITYLTADSNGISFDFVYNKQSYLFLFNKNTYKAWIIKKIEYGQENIRLPMPRYKVGSRYLGIYSWAMLNKLPLKNRTGSSLLFCFD